MEAGTGHITAYYDIHIFTGGLFAKTDIIHRQQEGQPIEDILLGLCYAVIRNFKTVIVKKLPVHKPVVLCGGVAWNEGVREVFDLSEQELIIPEEFPYIGAIGAAMEAGNIPLSVVEFMEELGQSIGADVIRDEITAHGIGIRSTGKSGREMHGIYRKCSGSRRSQRRIFTGYYCRNL